MKKVIVILLLSLLWACFVNAQYLKKDTILHNQFSDYIEWSKANHKKRLEDLETEKYQMIYVDKAIIDKKHHRVYFYSSYDLACGGENGIGINLYIKPKKKRK